MKPINACNIKSFEHFQTVLCITSHTLFGWTERAMVGVALKRGGALRKTMNMSKVFFFFFSYIDII